MKRWHDGLLKGAVIGMHVQRRVKYLLGNIAAVALVFGLLTAPAACNLTPTTVIRTTTTATIAATPPPGLPAFSDWRIAYLDGALKVHAVSADGRSDVTGGLSMLGLSTRGWSVPPAQMSPDGHLLAYSAPDRFEPTSGLSVLDASGQQAVYYNAGLYGYQMEWSPDGDLLAVNTDRSVAILGIGNDSITTVPPASSLRVTQVLGWTDAAHLVVIARQPSTPPTPAPSSTPVSSGPPSGPESTTLYVLDITSGALRPFVTLSSSTMGLPNFTLLPDGQTVLYGNRPFQGLPFTPDVALINVKTGAVTHLPHAAATGSGFTGVAFLPGTHTIAVSQGSFLAGAFKTWLVDTAHDTVTPIAATSGVAVGWVPGTHTLILSSGTTDSEATGEGPYTISAVPDVVSNPQAAATTLTTSAMTFPWLGFVKTA